jgi:hypothetical protein
MLSMFCSLRYGFLVIPEPSQPQADTHFCCSVLVCHIDLILHIFPLNHEVIYSPRRPVPYMYIHCILYPLLFHMLSVVLLFNSPWQEDNILFSLNNNPDQSALIGHFSLATGWTTERSEFESR